MKNIILSAILLFTISLTGFAQQMLRGKVTDKETGKPLAGASVTFAGSGALQPTRMVTFPLTVTKQKKSLSVSLAMNLILSI